jgi:hypothetical protein
VSYFQCLVIGKNCTYFSKASVWCGNKSLVISNWIEQYKEKKFGDVVYKSC